MYVSSILKRAFTHTNIFALILAEVQINIKNAKFKFRKVYLDKKHDI